MNLSMGSWAKGPNNGLIQRGEVNTQKKGRANSTYVEREIVRPHQVHRKELQRRRQEEGEGHSVVEGATCQKGKDRNAGKTKGIGS